ncbi:DMT family transporter [Argonema antarcticum]|uniref:DMT family transporter n=1 Tax=Argonema antarcticum TaxID=2942763 RepID=UPI002011FCC6|nr:SMR family transporter [Argonema antarcticum]MCL1472596.1 small multidrug resistance protein [Argonema antarcticum A004/B2]
MQTKLLFSLLILLSVGLNTSGQILLKQGSGQNPLNLYLLGGLSAYALSTVFYILVLGKLNLSVIYPVVIGLTTIGTTIAGVLIFSEKVSTVGWMGVGLVIAGISAIAFGKIS